MSAQGPAAANAPHNNGAQPTVPDAGAFNFELPTNAHSAPPHQDEITPIAATTTATNVPTTVTPATSARTTPQGQATQAPVTETSTTTNPTAQSSVPPATAMNPHTTAPTAAPTAAPAPAPASVSFSDQLDGSDRGWKVKALFRIICINLCLVGIGTIAWSISGSANGGYRQQYNIFIDYGADAFAEIWPSLVTFSVSIGWCLACLLLLALRKRPMHPGVCVAIDLILWLSFIATALFALVALFDLQGWGSDDSFGYSYGSSSGGYYTHATNGTIVWQPGSSDSVSEPRDCDLPNSDYYAGTHHFANCAEVDAYVNKLWQEKPHRVSVLTAGVVCQFFGLAIHLALFIWACVDTHRYNRSKVGKDAEKLAAGIVQTMINNGAIVPPPGQTYMRPGPGQGAYYQLPNQQVYPMMPMTAHPAPGHGQATDPRYHPRGPSTATGTSGAPPAPVQMVEKTATRYI